MGMGRALVVDDHPLVCEAIHMAIQRAAPGMPVTTCHTLAAVRDQHRPDAAVSLIALDFMLPDTEGFSALLALQELHPAARIAIVSGREDMRLVGIAAAFGAAGFIFKSTPMSDMIAMFKLILSGAHAFPPAFESRALPDAAASTARAVAAISPSQMRVVVALADGLPNKTIAYELGLSEATVKAHMGNLFKRFGVHNRTQLLAKLRPALSPLPA